MYTIANVEGGRMIRQELSVIIFSALEVIDHF